MKTVFTLSVFALVLTATSALYTPGRTKVALVSSKEDFKEHVMAYEGIAMVEFYAPWCGHCKSLAPEWEKAAKALNGVAKVVAVDATQAESLAQKYGIKGFPTIKVFGANKKKPVDYQGARDAKAIVDKAMSMTKSLVNNRLSGKSKSKGKKNKDKKKNNKKKNKARNGAGVVTLTASNFEDEVLESDDMWLVEFYAPWCGHCKKLEPEWKAAALELDGVGVKLGAVDATAHESLARQFEVKGYPTIKWFGPGAGKSASDAKDYQGAREADGIVDWALQTFEKLGGKVTPVEVRELTTNSIFDEQCTDGKKTCVVAVLPDILDGGASERNSLLEKYNAVIENNSKFGKLFTFSWTSANSHMDLQSKFRLEAFPSVVAINKGKSAYSVHLGAFSVRRLDEFLSGLMYGTGSVKKFAGELPTLANVDAWDGKDGILPEVEEDDFNLEDFLNDEL